MDSNPNTPRLAAGALALAVLAFSGAARSALTPDWIAALPVGAALSAGLQGMVVDAAGVAYVTGTSGLSSNTDITTAAYRPDGSLLWSHTFNGPQDWHDQARGIALGPGGVVYVTGNTPGPGLYANVLLLAYDAVDGTLLRTVQYSSGAFKSEHGASVVTDEVGNVYICGGTVGDGGDGLILKFDAGGAFQWKQTWDGPAFAPYSQDEAEKILLAPDGNPVVMISGVMASLHGDYVVVKYAATNGAVLWQATWGMNGDDFPTDMELDAAGDVYVTGVALDFSDKFGTIRLDGTDGSLIWQAYDSAGFRDAALALGLDGQGGVLITGTVDPDGDRSNANDNFYTVRRDAANGARLWTHSYGANCVRCFDSPSDVVADAAGNVLLAGSTSSPPYGGDVILFVLDLASGLETDRGIVAGGAAGTGVLAFDAAYDLYNGGSVRNPNTGEVDMSVTRWPSLVPDLYRVEVAGLVAGGEATITVTNATPGAMQYVVASTVGLGSTPLPRLGVTLDLAAPRLLRSGVADAGGAFQAKLNVPPGVAGRDLWVQVVEVGRKTPPVFATVQ